MSMWKWSAVFVFMVMALLSVAPPAHATGTIPLTFESSFTFHPTLAEDPDALAFNPDTGTLFVAIGHATNSKVYEVTTSGTILQQWQSGYSLITGLAFLPNGNLLLGTRQSGDNVVEFTTDGTPVPGGVSFNSVSFGAGDIGDITYNPFTGTIFIVSDDFRRVFEVALNGTFLRSFSTHTLTVVGSTEPFSLKDPEGLTYNPLNGNLWITSDFDNRFGQAPGSGTVYEVTLDGVLLASFDFRPTGFGDAEGIAVDPVNRMVYVAFDNERAIGVYRWQPAVLTDPSLLAGSGTSPAVAAAPDGGAVFAWRGPDERIRARRRSSAGALSSVKILSAAGGAGPEVAVDGDGNATVVWRGDDRRVHVRTRSTTGVLGPEEIISPSGRSASLPQVAVNAAGSRSARDPRPEPGAARKP